MIYPVRLLFVVPELRGKQEEKSKTDPNKEY